MKKIIPLFIVLGICLIFLPQAWATIDEGLVGYWPFNGNANDESGNGNHGTVHGATLTEDRFGNANSAYSFDGVDDYIKVPSFSTLSFNEITISVWLKITTSGGYINNRKIFTIDDGTDPRFHYFGIQGNSGGALSVYVYGEEVNEYDWAFDNNVWTHIAMSYDGNTVRLYKNGILTETGVIVSNTGSGHAYIGGDETGYSPQIWDGEIDDVRVYNRVLSEDEIKTLVPSQLIYYDDFNAGGFNSNWVSGGVYGDPDTITVVGGRVQATANGNDIETEQEFSGNLRIELDVEKVGESDHGCWDFGIELSAVNETIGLLRFDTAGIDGVGFGSARGVGEIGCGDDVSIPSSGVNKGKAILTYADSYISFSFINDDGDILDAGSIYAGQFDSSRIKIYLAAHSDTPRYVDNVKVYLFREPPPTESLLNVVAYIDGRSQLIVKGNEAKWYHLDYAAPGRHLGRDDPTFLNGVPFYPEWPESGENRWCNCFSSTFTDLSPSLPMVGTPMDLEIFRARHSVEIIQQPTADNDYELVIEFDDNPPGGADWYSIEVYRPENIPPEAICHDVTVQTEPGSCSADASIDDGSFDPDGDDITLEQDPPRPYDLGDTDVTLIVTDDNGDFDTCDATVTVIDEEDPVISSVTASPNKLWPPNHKMVPVAVTVDATDNCDSACQIILVKSNEPVNGLGDGNTAPDWIITGDLTVKLRAERSGKGNGRVYTITVECADLSGNSSTDTATVTVPHDKGKKSKWHGKKSKKYGKKGKKDK